MVTSSTRLPTNFKINNYGTAASVCRNNIYLDSLKGKQSNLTEIQGPDPALRSIEKEF